MKRRPDYSKNDSFREPYDISVVRETFKTTEYKRVSIQYKMGHCRTPAEIRTSELDALSLFSLTSNTDNLFTELQSHNVFSPLINHFAQCEQHLQPYTMPGRSKVMFVKHITHKDGGELQSISQGRREDFMHSQYRLSSGMNGVYAIQDYDPLFFESMCAAIDRGICKVARLDMCVDFSEDMMGLVSDCVKKGRVHSFGSNLKGYGSLNGVPFADEFVGRQGRFYKEFKGDDKTFRLDTLYCGKKRSNPLVLILYDKKKHSSSVEHQQHLDKTRAEIRLFAHKDDKYQGLMHQLFRSLCSTQGPFFRHVIFTQLLFSIINFSTTTKISNDFTETLAKSAGWWRSCFKVCLGVCTPDSRLLSQQEALFVEMIGNLRKPGTSPDDAVSFFNRLFPQVNPLKHEQFGPFPIYVENQPIEKGITSSLPANLEHLPNQQGKKTAKKEPLEEAGAPRKGRPKGTKDSQKFSKRGRPKKNHESPQEPSKTFTKRGRPKKEKASLLDFLSILRD